MPQDGGRWPGNLYVAGQITADSWGLSDGIITDNNIADGAKISALKVIQQYFHRYTQDFGAAVAAKHTSLFGAYGDGNLIVAEAGLIQACTGDATITIDILKNGVTVLSTPLVLDNTDAARDIVFGTLAASPVPYSAGDYFEVEVTVSPGTGALGQGLLVQVIVQENPTP